MTGVNEAPVAPDPLGELYRSHRAPMVRLAHLLTGSNAAAQDLVQQASAEALDDIGFEAMRARRFGRRIAG